MRKSSQVENVNHGYSLIALGANIPSWAGAPRDTLFAVCERISADADLHLVAVSPFVTTPAHPAGAGPDYINAAACIFSALDLDPLLARLHAIEAEFGRDRAQSGRWAARGIDLDLIAHGDSVRPDPAGQTRWRELPAVLQSRRAPQELILPHPRMQDRIFVLQPLSQIAPLWRHPITGLTVMQMLAALAHP